MMELDQIPEEVPIFLGPIDLDALNPNPETQHQFGPPKVAKPKWPRHGLSLSPTPEPRGHSYRGRRRFGMSNPMYLGLTQRRPNAGIQQVKPIPDCFTFGLPTPALRSPDRQFPGVRTQLEFDRFNDRLLNMTGPGLRNRLLGGSDDSDLTRVPKPC